MAGTPLKRRQQVEEDFLEASLHGCSSIAVTLLYRLVGGPGRPEPLFQVGGENPPELRCFVGLAPGHVGPGVVVREVGEVQAKTERSVALQDAAELLQVGRLAVGGQAHNLVLVAEFPEAEVLRDCGVVHP